MRLGRLILLALVGTLTLTQVNCNRTGKPATSQQPAVKPVKIPSATEWREAVSKNGRFRIRFPGDFEPRTEANEKGFSLVQSESHWLAYYIDYDGAMPTDDRDVRNAYKGSVASITRNGEFLLGQRDVFLNQRLGGEFVIDGPGRLSYVRRFLVGRRLYTLTVDRQVGDAVVDAKLPADIREFFDSFTYWEK